MPQGGGWWNRYVGLAGGILLITASGGVYGFGAIAAKLKAVLALTEIELGYVAGTPLRKRKTSHKPTA